MAVAADFHRNFLIPEHTDKACPTTNMMTYSDALRLFFCFTIISQIFNKSISDRCFFYYYFVSDQNDEQEKQLIYRQE